MVPSHQLNKTTTNSDSSSHSEDAKIVTTNSPEEFNQAQAINSDVLQTDKQNVEAPKAEPKPEQQKASPRRRNQSLKTKATALAVALGTIPIFLIGTADYFLSRKDLREDAIQVQESLAIAQGSVVSRFMAERYADIQELSSLHAFADPVMSKTMSLQQKEEILNRFASTNKAYDSIIVFDLKGNAIAQSKSAPFKGNYSDRKYYQEAIKTQNIVINKPSKSKSTGKLSVEMAAPIKELGTGKLIGVVRTRMPVEAFQKILQVEKGNSVKETAFTGGAYHLVDADGASFVANEETQGENAYSDIPLFAQMQANKKATTAEGFDKSDPDRQLISYAPVNEEGLPKLNWSVLIHNDIATAFAAERRLLLTLLLGTGLTALLVGLIAAYLVNRATRPILSATNVVEKLGQGELDTRVVVAGTDELATLGSNINTMASQLQTLVQSQTEDAQRTRLFADIASSRGRDSQDLDVVFNKAVTGAREILSVERVVVYRFNHNWSGYVTAESVADGWPQALANKIEDPCIGEQLIEAYRNGRVVPTENVFEAGFHPEHLQLMERLQIRANLVTPIVNNDQLFGLLVAHHCQHTHAWQQTEIDFLSQLASQLGLILDRTSLLEQQQAEAQRAQLVKDITVKLAQLSQTTGILNTAVQEIRLALNSDRVVVYSFNDKWQGTVIAESVAADWPRALGAEIDDPCFADKYVERYRQGRVQATDNLDTAGLTECHLKQLKQFAVKANLVAPILHDGQLLGLLIAHQCSGPRAWQQGEIDLFAQLATQVGFALDRATLLQQQKTAKELLQRRALELLIEVDPVSSGDLTVRANVTEDEIGTIADSYNATVANLRKIVTQVQTAATQVAATTSSNEVSVSELSQDALRQAQEIAVALERIQEMSNSIRAVAVNAAQAEVAVQQANQTVEAGDTVMNRTVAGIEAIRETVAETSQKVKRLGASSQKISKVVKLIGSFADQTNLLALNAAIEAARAGEEGRGFAVVADEVQALASQSTQATVEIESLVMEIQTETNEVVAAMEAGTVQVVEGTKLVDETRQSLNNITAVSTQIGALVAAIAAAAATQSQTSEAVTQTISDVAAIASQNSNEATLVSASFKELLVVAQELQASAGQFKVS